MKKWAAPSPVNLFICVGALFLIFIWATYPDIEHLCATRRLERAPSVVNRAALQKVPHRVRCASGADLTAQRLAAAERNWLRGKMMRNTTLEKAHLTGGLSKEYALTLWDFFYPSFDCPYTKERIGRVGDGGKWICGFDQLEVKTTKCVVLSFGVSQDTSFEDEVLQRAPNCTVHMFDPTISGTPSIVDRYRGRAFFRPIGIGAKNAGKIVTLKTLLDEIGVKSVDVLKMDVEGAEWETLRKIVEDFPGRLPFAQLQVEVHLGHFGAGDWLRVLTTWFESLEAAGLRQFFQEPNLIPTERFPYRELAFLNTKAPPFQLLKVNRPVLKQDFEILNI